MAHLLNVVWPNIFETSPHVINAVMDAIEGLRVALGPIRILQYTLQVGSRVLQLALHVRARPLRADRSRGCGRPPDPTHLQGLFHPARKVREVYWKIYNNLYIGSQDAIIAAYPRIEDDDRNLYRRYELDYTL